MTACTKGKKTYLGHDHDRPRKVGSLKTIAFNWRELLGNSKPAKEKYNKGAYFLIVRQR